MRIIAIADTHGDEVELGQLPAGDVLIHAGDLCWDGTEDELRPVAEWLRSQPHRHKLLVAGNHDELFAADRSLATALFGDCVRYLEDSGVTIDGVRFWGSPWHPSIDDGAFRLPHGDACVRKWAEITEDVDVLITHGPPHGFGDQKRGLRLGCDEMLKAVRRAQPSLHVYGHVHQDGGVWQAGRTCFGNVTTWESCRGPTVFDLNPQTGDVTPISVPPRTVTLH